MLISLAHSLSSQIAEWICSVYNFGSIQVIASLYAIITVKKTFSCLLSIVLLFHTTYYYRVYIVITLVHQ